MSLICLSFLSFGPRRLATEFLAVEFKDQTPEGPDYVSDWP